MSRCMAELKASQFVPPRVERGGTYGDSSEGLLAMNGNFCSEERRRRGGGN